MKQFNKDSALRRIRIKQNKNTYIKRLSISLSCLILIVIVMLFTFAKFEVSSDVYTLINGRINYSTCEYSEGQVVFEKGYTGKEETFVPNCKGQYMLEVWGAQGGTYDNDNYHGGYGGYSTGIISLGVNRNLFINVGGEGSIQTSSEASVVSGGYNGGGNGFGKSDKLVSGGGGATSIASRSGLLKDLSSYKGDLSPDGEYYLSDTIIIVAGGGGGSAYETSNKYGNGGSGGGKCGGNNNTTATGQTFYLESPGCQTSSSFGTGVSSDSRSGPGGGGGFYGGNRGIYWSGAPGGSGYISSPNLKSFFGITKHMYCYDCQTSDIENVKTISDGASSCHNANPTADCAKEGNGYARITYLGKESTNKYIVNLDANGGTVSKPILIVTNGQTYGELPTPTRGDREFLGWYTDKYNGTKVESNTVVNLSSEQTLYAHYKRKDLFIRGTNLGNSFTRCSYCSYLTVNNTTIKNPNSSISNWQLFFSNFAFDVTDYSRLYIKLYGGTYSETVFGSTHLTAEVNDSGTKNWLTSIYIDNKTVAFNILSLTGLKYLTFQVQPDIFYNTSWEISNIYLD